MLIINKKFEDIIGNSKNELSESLVKFISDYPNIQIWNKTHDSAIRVINQLEINDDTLKLNL